MSGEGAGCGAGSDINTGRGVKGDGGGACERMGVVDDVGGVVGVVVVVVMLVGGVVVTGCG